LVCILLSNNFYAQQIEIQITGASDKAFLSELSGEKIVVINSGLIRKEVSEFRFVNFDTSSLVFENTLKPKLVFVIFIDALSSIFDLTLL
jgi:hypothetical protein